MEVFQCLIKLKLLLLLIVVSVQADCDICIATFNIKRCADRPTCSSVEFICYDGENSETTCQPSGLVPLLLKSQRKSNCEDTTTQPPDTTTQAPETTTQAPDTTTEAPGITTEAPGGTAEAPGTTTPSTPVDPGAICENVKGRKLFPDPSDDTCTKYIVCHEHSAWTAMFMTCPNGMYFNKDLEKCQREKPADCV